MWDLQEAVDTEPHVRTGSGGRGAEPYAGTGPDSSPAIRQAVSVQAVPVLQLIALA